MVVCSRCSGLYAGAALGILYPQSITPDYGAKLLWLAVSLTLAQLIAQHIIGINHTQRLLSGLFLGLVISMLASSALRSIANYSP